MKVDPPNTVRGTRAVGVSAYARQAGSIDPVASEQPIVSSSVLGIPESEFTPRVRNAIMALMGEVESLRRELSQTRERLDEVEKSADLDQLLPLLNRRAFVRELMRHISYSGRYGTAASLLYFDVDDFKMVNDTYGHAGGDAVLAHFAEILAANVRDSDIVGRLGGDEFGIMLPQANLEQAHRKADRLAACLESSPTLWRDQVIASSFSYGALELKPGEDAETAMARADEAMYANKRSVTTKR